MRRSSTLRSTVKDDHAAEPRRGVTAFTLACAVIALVASACGGGSSRPGIASGGSAAGQSSTSNSLGSSNSHSSGSSSQLVPFADCMRAHRVADFPDPNSSDKLPGAQQLGVSPSRYRLAMNACRHLLPNGGNAPAHTQLQQESTALLPFARCMRSHGVTNWPDPTIYTNSDGQTAVVFNFIGTNLDGNGINSPQVRAASQQCHHLLPPGNGGPSYRIVRN
jgi:hypothetical protein